MDFSISEYEFGQRPSVTLPSPEFLKLVSEEGIRKLVSDHYDLLSKSEVKHLFPRIEEALDKAKQRSSDFFIQICGGHPYYNKSRGKPMLAARHTPVRAQGREAKTAKAAPSHCRALPKRSVHCETSQGAAVACEQQLLPRAMV